MNGNHHPTGPMLQAFFDGELVGAEATKVEAHCRDCDECRGMLAELAAVQDRLKMTGTETMPSSIWPSVAAQVKREQGQRLGPAFAFGTAAACAAGIVMGLLVGTPPTSEQVDGDQVVWTSSSQLWTGSESASLLDVYSSSQEQEGSDGS